MPRYAVSHVSLHDNNLTTIIVEAPHERAALAAHTQIAECFPGEEVEPDDLGEEVDPDFESEIEGLEEAGLSWHDQDRIKGDLFDEGRYPDVESLREAAFDQDILINVVEIPATGESRSQIEEVRA